MQGFKKLLCVVGGLFAVVVAVLNLVGVCLLVGNAAGYVRSLDPAVWCLMYALRAAVVVVTISFSLMLLTSHKNED